MLHIAIMLLIKKDCNTLQNIYIGIHIHRIPLLMATFLDKLSKINLGRLGVFKPWPTGQMQPKEP